jgi:hypothetical protein
MEMSDKLHDQATLPQGKSPQYPLDRSLCGLQSGTGRCVVEKYILASKLKLKIFTDIKGAVK